MSHPRISLIHPTGNPNSREAALALGELGLLHEVITTIAFNPKSKTSLLLLERLPVKLRNIVSQELGRRTWLAPPGALVKSHPWQEIARLGLLKSGINKFLGLQYQHLTDLLYLSLDRHVSKHHLQDVNAVYAYEDGAATAFKIAKQKGILCLYDLPILFYRTSQKIQAEEAELFPQLASALQAAKEPKWKIERKEQEIQLADRIFVASSVTQKSLLNAGIPPDKISVIPYGAPLDYFKPQPKLDKTFRALFIGRVGPRKGVHYLLEAWRSLQLPKAELKLVGVNEFPDSWFNRYESLIHYISSVPHASLNEYYSSASVFVFPSLVEGFGLVLLEAMACGIPVIATTNTAAPDIITDGVDGFIISIRDVDALKEKLEWCYNNPEELAEMGKAARRKAEQLTWSLYRQQLANQVKAAIQK